MKNWLERRYKSLREKFQDKPFTFQQAVEELKLRHQDKKEQVNMILSELRKNNYISVDFNKDDNRKRIYTIINQYNIDSISRTNSAIDINNNELNKLLDRAADLIKNRVDNSYLLLSLFYKRIINNWKDINGDYVGEDISQIDINNTDLSQEMIDILNEWGEIYNLEQELRNVEKKIENYLKKVGEK